VPLLLRNVVAGLDEPDRANDRIRTVRCHDRPFYHVALPEGRILDARDLMRGSMALDRGRENPPGVRGKSVLDQPKSFVAARGVVECELVSHDLPLRDYRFAQSRQLHRATT